MGRPVAVASGVIGSVAGAAIHELTTQHLQQPLTARTNAKYIKETRFWFKRILLIDPTFGPIHTFPFRPLTSFAPIYGSSRDQFLDWSFYKARD